LPVELDVRLKLEYWIPYSYLQPKEKIKNKSIKVGIELGSKLLMHPTGQRWRLIVDEYPPIAYAGLALGSQKRQSMNFSVLLYRNICPPMPAM
jgi:hypothetical protein